jgi:hypothetical protein
VARVRLNLASENRATLKLLIELVKQFPGNTVVEPIDFPGGGWTLGRLARRRIFFCSPLFQGLCKILAPEAIELYGNGGERLKVLSPAPPREDEAEGEETPDVLSSPSQEEAPLVAEDPIQFDLPIGDAAAGRQDAD